jgi:hypothetical protein
MLALAFVLGLSAAASAGEPFCAHCGCTDGCCRVCRLVCEEKKVEVICWGCTCEDFCLPCPSTPGCRYCEDIYEPCDEGDKPVWVCTRPKRFTWLDWCPGSARMHTKKKLMKRVVIRKIPVYKWVVEDLCPRCEAECPIVEVPPGTKLPPPPNSGR